MADQTASNDSAAAAANVSVEGWNSGNWTRSNDEGAVIINPKATPLELLSWAVGQLEQTIMLMEVIGTSHNHSSYEPADVVGALRHPAEQALVVLRRATDMLFDSHAHRASTTEERHG